MSRRQNPSSPRPSLTSVPAAALSASFVLCFTLAQGAALSGCATGEPDPQPEPSPVVEPDAGVTDAGIEDAGVVDAGPPDSGVEVDAGPTECPAEGCDDGNPCVDWDCGEHTGFVCTSTNKPDFTNCSNACQPQASCSAGVCEGDVIPGINDYNPCTEDVCDGTNFTNPISHIPLDGASCPTTNQCKLSGICVQDQCDQQAGEDRDCDDGNDCTIDRCDPTAGGCQPPDNIEQTNECRVAIQVDFPARGATLAGAAGNRQVLVIGNIVSGVGAIVSATANGVDLLAVGNDPTQQQYFDHETGNFSRRIPVDEGVNVLIITARDEGEQTHQTVQSFMWATDYSLPDETGLDPYLADDIMGIYLGADALDDGDHSFPPNDLATLFESGLQDEFRLGDLLGDVNGLSGLSFNYNSSSIDANLDTANVTHSPVRVSLAPKPVAAMAIAMRLDNIQIPMGLPSGQGFSNSPTLGFTSIDLTADLAVIADGNGRVNVTPDPSTVEVTIGDIVANTGQSDADDALEGLLTPLTPFLEDAFRQGFRHALYHEDPPNSGTYVGITPTIGDMFSAFSFEQTIPLASLEEGGEPLNVRMISTVYQDTFSERGGLFRLKGGASAEATIDISQSQGVPIINGCKGTVEALHSPEVAPVELLFTDTMLNQVFYAAWSAGLLNIEVDEAIFGDLGEVGIENLQVSVEGLAPPTATACTPNDELLFHVGDMRIFMNFTFNGAEVNAVAHTSFTTELFLIADPVENAIRIEIGAPKVPSLELESPINTDIAIAEDDQIDIGPIVVRLINENLVDSLLSGLSGGLGTIPLPDFDIGDVAEGQTMNMEKLSDEEANTMFAEHNANLLDGGVLMREDAGSVYHFENTSVVNAAFVGE